MEVREESLDRHNPTSLLDRLSVLSNAQFIGLIGLLCVAAYLPGWDNGFIADDLVLLDGANPFGGSITRPFEFDSSQYFRLTSYFAFGALKYSIGYQAWALYAFTTILHFVNAVLVFFLFLRLDLARSTAGVGALMFAVVVYGDEAVLWLAGMNESLMTFGLLSAFLLWIRGNYAWTAVFYCFALISKEAAPIILPLILLVEWARGSRLRFETRYLYLLVPTALFGGAFLFLLGSNSIIGYGRFSFTLDATVVMLRSLHRMFYPWLYALLIACWVTIRGLPARRTFLLSLALVAIALLPYAFLDQRAVASRHQYLASIPLCWVMAESLVAIGRERIREAFLVSFVLINISLFWVQKDGQYEERAAPTEQLIATLRTIDPQPVLIEGFAYPFPAIAKAATPLVQGWTPDLIRLPESDEPCAECVVLRWSEVTGTYIRE